MNGKGERVASSGSLPPSASARMVFVREKGIRNALAGAFRDLVLGTGLLAGSPGGPEANAGCVLSGQRILKAASSYFSNRASLSGANKRLINDR